jgi:flagella basal body P-ring formation protein FlgA
MRVDSLRGFFAAGVAALVVLSGGFGSLNMASAVDLKSLLEPVPGSAFKREGNAAVAGGVPGAMVLTEGELVRAIQLDLPKRFPFKGEYRVQMLRPWVALPLPGKDFFAECLQIPEGGLRSTMSVVVRGVSGGKIVGEWPVQIRVELIQEVWVAPQRLERGEVLRPGLLVPQKMDVVRESAPLIDTATDLIGMELAQAVPQGRPLTKRDLVERSLVKRGQFVDAVASEGGLNIRMRAMALEAGAAGAVIRVKNLESNKEFVGQVVGENLVQVRF